MLHGLSSGTWRQNPEDSEDRRGHQLDRGQRVRTSKSPDPGRRREQTRFSRDLDADGESRPRPVVKRNRVTRKDGEFQRQDHGRVRRRKGRGKGKRRPTVGAPSSRSLSPGVWGGRRDRGEGKEIG